jgi:hypothetical protein
VDFGADESMGKSAQKVKEHYGIDVPISVVQMMTLKHAGAMREARNSEVEKELPKGGIDAALCQADGTMIPIVTIKPKENDQSPPDGRKRRSVSWHEARLVFARDLNKVTRRYAATMGVVEQAAELLFDCLVKVGGGTSTDVHSMGDGATWIPNRTLEKFEGNATYLLDFYHVSEYLAHAADVVVTADHKRCWLAKQQQHLKNNEVGKVLRDLERHSQTHDAAKCSRKIEPTNRPECPAEKCKRYLENRLDYIDYKSAIEAGLPIGTGEAEGAHRSIIQARIKKSGAWWLEEHVDRMLALRTNRANQEWEPYWAKLRQDAA